MSHFRINGVIVVALSISGIREILEEVGRIPKHKPTIFVAETHRAESRKKALDTLEEAYRSTAQGKLKEPGA